MADVGTRILKRKESFASRIGIGGEYPLDEAITAALPKDLQVISAVPYGSSAWSVTAKVTAQRTDGEYEYFFLKCVPGDLGKAMFTAEFDGMSELSRLTPNFAPRPLSWGKLKLASPETYFFLEEFKFFARRLPDPAKLGARVAELHQKSQSPTGMFGYHIATYDGAKEQDVRWDPSWASLFTKLLKHGYELDVRTNGIWKELDEVFQRTLTHVIPRLLGTLQEEGRTLKPCLIHGDMWEGNIGTEQETGDPWIFDSAVYYAHCEMELGIWTAERHELRAKAYKLEYLRNMEPDEPAEEWDDRNRLYRTKTNFAFSADYPDTPPRKDAYQDLKYLVQKYAPYE